MSQRSSWCLCRPSPLLNQLVYFYETWCKFCAVGFQPNAILLFNFLQLVITITIWCVLELCGGLDSYFRTINLSIEQILEKNSAFVSPVIERL
jgi:hypothetical protein